MKTINQYTAPLFIVFILVAGFLFLSPTPTYAQSLTGVQCPIGETYIAILDACLDFGNTVSLTVTWSLLLGTLIALIRFAIGAVQMILSTGEPGKLENARLSVTDAVIGLIIIISAWILLGYASSALPPEWGINFFVLPFGLGGPAPTAAP